jgi:hypothetical protein
VRGGDGARGCHGLPARYGASSQRLPDVLVLDEKWGEILSRRETHLNLVRQHLGLGLDAKVANVSHPQPQIGDGPKGDS